MKTTGSFATALALALLASPALSQVQSAEQQACTTGIEKNFTKLIKAGGKEISSCVKDIAKSKTSAGACFGEDRKGKIDKSEAATEALYASACVTARPDFGFGGVDAAIGAADASDDVLLATLFGDDLAAALPVGAPDAVVSDCQQGVTKAFLKCHDTRMKTYAKCNRAALAAGATDATATIACIGDDAKGKIAKRCDLDSGGKVDKIRAAIAGCAGADLVAAFPSCNTADPAVLHACLTDAEACSACDALAELTDSELVAD